MGFGLGIIYRLFCFAFFCVLLLHPGTGLFDPAVQHSALVFQLRHTGIVVFALCKIILVFFAVPVGFCFCRKNPQCLLLRLDLFHGVTSQPGTAFFLQLPPLLVQPLLFVAQLPQLVCLAQLIPYVFLQRPVISLVFGGFLCYTCISRKARAFTALLGFEYRVSAFLLLFYVSGIVQHQQTAIRPANFVNIEFVSLFRAAVLIYNYRFVDPCAIYHNWCHKGICVIFPTFPVLHKTNLFTVSDNIWYSRSSDLFYRAIPMLHGRLCAFTGQFYGTKSSTFYLATNRFKESHNVFGIFFVGRSVRDLLSGNFSRRMHLF